MIQKNKNTPLVIAIDGMGGDFGPDVVVPAALLILEQYAYVSIILFGHDQTLESVIQRCLAKKKSLGSLRDRLIVMHAEDTVLMDEPPASALRNKKKSSMRLALNAVAEGKATAFVSAGNTGALLAMARFVLNTLPGVDRPAILSEIPTRQGKTRMIDLGANVDTTPQHLYQFACMGSVLSKALDQIEAPRVALLNVGIESIKGNELVKQTDKLLSQAHAVNYVGYIEGDKVYDGEVDIVVCDGFSGNIALKTSEGVAKLIAYYMRQAFTRNIWARFAAFIAYPVLRHLKKQIDPSRYNGASFVGLPAVVIKSHGGANELGFRHAIEEAIHQATQQVPLLIQHRLESLLRVSKES